ncbi:MAG: XerD/XerC family integrase, partial [Candidatus Methanohalarchaeum thermophilum]
WTKIQLQSHNKKEAEYEKLPYASIRKLLRQAKEKAKLDKKVTITKFRHSRATDLAKKGFTSSQLCSWLGWVQGSDMPQVYIHLAGRDVDDAYKKIHGIEEKEENKEPQMTPRTCVKCGYKEIPPTKDICPNCMTLLNENKRNNLEEKAELIEQIKEIDKEVIEKLKKIDKKTLEKS